VSHYEGVIRSGKTQTRPTVVAALSCFYEYGYPAQDLVASLRKQDPDLLFFSGDQLYEGNGGLGIQTSPIDAAMMDYLRKWNLWGWAFGELTRDRPTVCEPDDHDVFNSNLWGNGGRVAPEAPSKPQRQDLGGYVMPAQFVRMVERTQTSHLPAPANHWVSPDGIGCYYTTLNFRDLSIAIVEDRKFKSAPKNLLPQADIYNGFPQNRAFDWSRESDVPGAELLGAEQEKFLSDWAKENRAPFRVVFSQTLWTGMHTLPKSAMSDDVVPSLVVPKPGEYPPDDVPAIDLDTNGWPQTPRNRILRSLAYANVLHVTGDQHLTSVIRYGIDRHDDGPFAICCPSVSNIWPRRWMPMAELGTGISGLPPYAGRFTDAFGHPVTVYAVANPVVTGQDPRLYDRVTGYSIIRFDSGTGERVLESWPRLPSTKPFPGWPVTISADGTVRQ
ncbi:MAG: alkaline phosphatase D family protein, partial [Fimbriimonadaceae bacterium]|nr:alkaline phosphatase D family protein [Fimbriimonadaceae bacterium]